MSSFVAVFRAVTSICDATIVRMHRKVTACFIQQQRHPNRDETGGPLTPPTS
jgi:hypothetical protein